MDGSTDDSAAAIGRTRWTFPIRILEQPASGPAAARNRGAAGAQGDLLLFIDDDVEPERRMLAAHQRFHARLPNAVGLGELPPVVSARGMFGVRLRGWWEGMYDGPREPGHRYVYRDLLSGHFSIGRRAFDGLGRFDPALRCHEDYELGYRAIEAGMTVRLVADAVARHHEQTDLARALRRKRDEGVADVALLRRYPAIAPQLPLARVPSLGAPGRWLLRQVWTNAHTTDRVARALQSMLAVYEFAALRFRWRALLEDLLAYWYWRGVASASGGRAALETLIRVVEPEQAPEVVLDLARGVDVAQAELDAVKPRSVRLRYGNQPIGDVSFVAGAERLSGRHLPRLIARQFAREFIAAAARSGALPPTLPRPLNVGGDADGADGGVDPGTERRMAVVA